MISVNSFGQALHLVTKKGNHTQESVEQYLTEKGETEIAVESSLATIEDVFILLMNHQKHLKQ